MALHPDVTVNSVVHPIARAWVSTGGTGARNYDEFADEAEITAIVAANPDSALSIEMPHRAPESLGKTFAAALPDAVARLDRQISHQRYSPAHDIVALYRIDDPSRSGATTLGLFAMVDTDQISTTPDEPGLIIRNEDVFIEKVRERVELAQATGHLLSPVLLLQTASGDRLQAVIAAAIAAAGEPAVTDVDHVGRTHSIWPLPVQADAASALIAAAGGGELVVADGNHRSLAAQIGGLRRFLAVITAPSSVSIQPYHRLVSSIPGQTTIGLIEQLSAAGAHGQPLSGPVGIPEPGTICLYARGAAPYLVRLPDAQGSGVASSGVEHMDHAVVERLLLDGALGLDPGDKRITYVGGDYPPTWLIEEVDAGRADLAVLIAPVSVADFVAVNLARQKLPRKSTWFTPKARAGLILADLAGLADLADLAELVDLADLADEE